MILEKIIYDTIKSTMLTNDWASDILADEDISIVSKNIIEAVKKEIEFKLKATKKAEEEALKVLRKYENRPTGYDEDEIVNAMIEYSDSKLESIILAKEQLKERFENEIAVQHDYFNHRGGLVDEVFEWFWQHISKVRLEKEND